MRSMNVLGSTWSASAGQAQVAIRSDRQPLTVDDVDYRIDLRRDTMRATHPGPAALDDRIAETAGQPGSSHRADDEIRPERDTDVAPVNDAAPDVGRDAVMAADDNRDAWCKPEIARRLLR